jgi:hypothetical protein
LERRTYDQLHFVSRCRLRYVAKECLDNRSRGSTKCGSVRRAEEAVALEACLNFAQQGTGMMRANRYYVPPSAVVPRAPRLLLGFDLRLN